MNLYLLRNTLVAALGGLLFGFDTAVISGTTRALSQTFSLTPDSLGFAVSSALWGTVLGSVLAGPASDKYGRSAALRVLAVLYCISAFGCAFALDLPMFVICRVIGGIAIGGSSVIGPMYIAEIAPADKRGRLVGLFQFNIVLGILVAYFSNYLVGLGGFGDAEWRWKLGVAAVPAVLFFFALFGIPQSPRWLVAAGRNEEARDVLTRIGEKNPDAELNNIVEAAHRQHAEQRVPLFQRKYALPIFLAISLGMFNQLTGINAILYYLNDIFERAGFNKVSSDLQAVAIGATNLLFTVIAMTMIDNLGRKKLLLTGALGTAACLAGVTIIFATRSHESLLVWLLVGFIAFFAFSQGAVIWVYLSEVFPNVVRAKGLSLGCFTHWLMNALISGFFPHLAKSSAAAPFAFFAVMTLTQFFVVLFVYPETSRRTLESMDEAVHAV